jgi:hypothetical protein
VLKRRAEQHRVEEGLRGGEDGVRRAGREEEERLCGMEDTGPGRGGGRGGQLLEDLGEGAGQVRDRKGGR